GHSFQARRFAFVAAAPRSAVCRPARVPLPSLLRPGARLADLEGDFVALRLDVDLQLGRIKVVKSHVDGRRGGRLPRTPLGPRHAVLAEQGAVPRLVGAQLEGAVLQNFAARPRYPAFRFGGDHAAGYLPGLGSILPDDLAVDRVELRAAAPGQPQQG